MFSDPLKLLPLVGCVGVMVLVGLGRLNAQDALMLLAGVTGIHAGISALNNVNPPKK